jgi:hypothetical protein
MQGFSAEGSAATGDAPIYERLVRERGDVPAQTRQFAERTLRDSERTVNFGAGPASVVPVHAPVVTGLPALTLLQEAFEEPVTAPAGEPVGRDWFSARRQATGWTGAGH